MFRTSVGDALTVILTLSPNIYRILVHFLLKNDKYLRMKGVNVNRRNGMELHRFFFVNIL
jgi:hypothetical protein